MCESLDGTIWSVEDDNIPNLPLHPGCECTLEDYEGSGEERSRKELFAAKRANSSRDELTDKYGDEILEQ